MKEKNSRKQRSNNPTFGYFDVVQWNFHKKLETIAIEEVSFRTRISLSLYFEFTISTGTSQRYTKDDGNVVVAPDERELDGYFRYR